MTKVAYWKENRNDRRRVAEARALARRFEASEYAQQEMPLDRAVAAWVTDPDNGLNATAEQDGMQAIVGAVFAIRTEDGGPLPLTEVRLTENLREMILMDAIDPISQDGLLWADHDEYRDELAALALALIEPNRTTSRGVFVRLSPREAAELVRQIQGVYGIWDTRASQLDPYLSSQTEIEEANQARGAMRAGERVIRELSNWLQEEVGVEVTFGPGLARFRFPTG